MTVLYSSAAAEASAVASTSSVKVDEIICTNLTSGRLFLHVFDSATLPADTTAPIICITVPADSTVSYDPERSPAFGSGVAVCLSTTGATKTLTGTNDGVFTVRGF